MSAQPRFYDAPTAADTWPDGGHLPVGELFEGIIEVNRQRGYVLHSFQLHRLMTGPEQMNETVIAVFERVAEERGRDA